MVRKHLRAIGAPWNNLTRSWPDGLGKSNIPKLGSLIGQLVGCVKFGAATDGCAGAWVNGAYSSSFLRSRGHLWIDLAEPGKATATPDCDGSGFCISSSSFHPH
jgi:hypothetical protein